MSASDAYADRRQFGRRPSNIGGYVVLPGHVIAPCRIVNLSDGGALLDFGAELKLPPSLRLAVEGTDFNLLCEVRHRGQGKAGVRFVRQSEGAQLTRHFQPVPIIPASGEVPAPRPAPAVASISNRNLRQMVLGILYALEQELPADACEPESDVDPDTDPINGLAASLAAFALLGWPRSAARA